MGRTSAERIIHDDFPKAGRTIKKLGGDLDDDTLFDDDLSFANDGKGRPTRKIVSLTRSRLVIADQIVNVQSQERAHAVARKEASRIALKKVLEKIFDPAGLPE